MLWVSRMATTADQLPSWVVTDCAGTGAKNSRLRPLIELVEPIRNRALVAGSVGVEHSTVVASLIETPCIEYVDHPVGDIADVLSSIDLHRTSDLKTLA